MTFVNRKWTLARRPEGAFNPASDAVLEQEAVDLRACPDTHVVCRVEMLSVDAFVRTMLDEGAYHGVCGIGSVIPALGYGTVVHAGSKSGRRAGERVLGLVGAQLFATVPVGGEAGVHKVIALPFLPASSVLGLLGLTTGLTAYVGVFRVAKSPPKKTDCVVVSAASGAVGHIAAQLAKTTGARVVGIAGGAAKCLFLENTLGLHASVDYKSKDMSVSQQLDIACPDGIDFFYDNVGGDILDAVLARLNPNASVIVCGAASQYSGNLNKGKVQGPKNYLKLAERGCSMTGFNVIQYMWSLPVAILFMIYYYMRGLVVVHEKIHTGIASFPGALAGLFTGGQPGKTLCDVGKDWEDARHGLPVQIVDGA